MKFRHSFNVFVDNFSVAYKHLLYKVVVTVIAACLYTAVVYPFIKGLMRSAEFTALTDGLMNFIGSLTSGNAAELGEISEEIRENFLALMTMISNNRANIILGVFGILIVHLIEKFFNSLGNYTLASVINDRMAMRTHSSYLGALIGNLRQASLYSVIYTPISVLYDLVCYVGLYFIIFRLLFFFVLPLRLFLYVTAIVAATSVKMTFTTDWLPALIRGKMSQKEALLFTFDRKNKNTFNVLSNFSVLVMIIFAVNVAAAVCTFGAAVLLTVPSSYILLVSFEFVNYYDREELKYFIDKNTIIKPAKEIPLTKEEFFRGESE